MDDDVDRLYSLPLAEFTAARNQLAVGLRKAGQRDAAERIKGLPKPSISAWAINQLVRRKREQVDRVLAAGDELRVAQAALLSGSGRADFQSATKEEREAVSSLVRAASSVLTEAGYGVSKAVLDRIEATLHAATVDGEGRSLLASGRLAEDLEPSGFNPLVAFAPAEAAVRSAAPTRPKLVPQRAEPSSPEAPTPLTTRRSSVEQEQQARARGRMEEARSRAETARRDAEKLQNEAVRAERAAAEAKEAALVSDRNAASARAQATATAEGAALAEREYQLARAAFLGRPELQ